MPVRRSPTAVREVSRLALRLIATTDLHVHIHPYDYYADRPAPGTGLAHAAALIGTLRDQWPNSLLLDNGDILQGNPMGDYVAEVRGLDGTRPHPAIAAMNVLGYDAATLGNHEFNYGLDFLHRALAGARFPVTSANAVRRLADDPALDDTLLPPFLILERHLRDCAGRAHAIRIGVIGILPPQIMVWDSGHLQGRIAARDSLAAVRARLPQMRAAGADVIVALCHSGIGPAEPSEGMENAATALGALPGIDAIIAGHSHLVFPSPDFPSTPAVDASAGTLCGTPAVMPGRYGSHLGVIDLVLERRGETAWRVARARSRALPVTPTADSAAHPRTTVVLAATRADHNATLAHIRRPAGQSEVALNTFFAALPGNAALDLIAHAQAWQVASALAGSALADLPLLSAASPFKMGGRGGAGNYTDVPAGPLALRHLADLYPYPNGVAAVVLTGLQLREWLERATGLFHRISPGLPDQRLIDTTEPASRFEVLFGVTWEVDLACPAWAADGRSLKMDDPGRVRNLRHAGRPVAARDRFVLATNTHRAGGAEAFPGTGTGAAVYEGAEPTRNVLMRYLCETGPVRAPGAAQWRFVPLPGTSVLYDTAPQAAAHLGSLGALRIEPVGPAPGGFQRFRIHL